jgi:hypothetical protein
VFGEDVVVVGAATIIDPEFNTEDLNSPTAVVAAPILLGESGAQALAEGDANVAVMRIGEDSVAEEYLGISGDFVINCSLIDDSTADCMFVDASGNPYEIEDTVEVFDESVTFSSVYFAESTIYIKIPTFLGTICIRIG